MTHLHLLDPICFFCQRNWCTYTWRKRHRDGRIITSCCDYILFSDGLQITNAQIVNPEQFSTDHYVVWITIPCGTLKSHQRLQRICSRLPYISPVTPDKIAANTKLQTLMHHKLSLPKPTHIDAWQRSWISSKTWALIDERHAKLRNGASREILRDLRHKITKSLN